MARAANESLQCIQQFQSDFFERTVHPSRFREIMIAGMIVRYGDAADAGEACRNYAFLGVFQNHALRRCRAKPLGRGQEYIRRWFDLRHIQAGDDYLEIMSDTKTR